MYFSASGGVTLLVHWAGWCSAFLLVTHISESERPPLQQYDPLSMVIRAEVWERWNKRCMPCNPSLFDPNT